MPPSRGPVQRRAPVAAAGSHSRARSEQRSEAGLLAAGCRQRRRRPAVAIRSFVVGAGLEQRCQAALMAAAGRQVQRAPTAAVRHSARRADGQQRPQARLVALHMWACAKACSRWEGGDCRGSAAAEQPAVAAAGVQALCMPPSPARHGHCTWNAASASAVCPPASCASTAALFSRSASRQALWALSAATCSARRPSASAASMSAPACMAAHGRSLALEACTASWWLLCHKHQGAATTTAAAASHLQQHADGGGVPIVGCQVEQRLAVPAPRRVHGAIKRVSTGRQGG